MKLAVLIRRRYTSEWAARRPVDLAGFRELAVACTSVPHPGDEVGRPTKKFLSSRIMEMDDFRYQCWIDEVVLPLTMSELERDQDSKCR